ncbi:hypothetical protein [Hafnia paralvei]|uniref:hypothetical protein n=1 Tax=Hafnia paralvei TaxID=546367 RepID=UPI00210994BD|nr:hypothetical protein [Hafnia paralvei]MCQ4169681.1 hypothetical protein [Hafnia paralvei]
MTVSTEVDHNDYIGNSVTTVFPYQFRIFKAADLTVVTVDLNENQRELILGTDYTVTGAGSYQGGNVILVSALANGWKISIARELPVTQDTDLRNQGKFFAEVHENAFDKLTMLIQQTFSRFSLALRKPSYIANYYDALNNRIRNLRDPSQAQDAATKNYADSLSSGNTSHTDLLFGRTLRTAETIPQLPAVELRRNKIVGMDNDGNPIMLLPESGSAADVLLLLASPEGYTYIPSVQIQQWKNEGDVRGWGEGEDGFNAAMTEMSDSGGGVLYVNEDITFSAIPIMHKPKVTVYWNGNRAIVPAGLTATYGYIMDGGADTPVYDNTDHFTRANKTNCYGLRLEASDYTVGVNAIGVCVRHCYGWTYEGGAIIGFNNGGFEDEFCYEGKASKFTMVVANTRDEQSIGLHIKCTDGWYSEISPVGYAYGGKVIKSGNSLDKFHPWGNTVDNRVGVMGKMHVGLWVTDNGGFTSYSNLILDTPVRRNTGSVPSRANGGVGLICDAWDTSFTDVLIAASRNDTPQKSTLPMITTSQGASFHNFSVSNSDYSTDIWVSFENNSGIAKNHFSGYGYAEKMRIGMTIGPNSGAALAPATNVSIGQQALSSGIWLNTLTYSITTTASATTAATSDVVVSISPIYGVTSGSGGSVKGGMFAFYYATANSSKQLYDVSIEVVSPNTAKFLLTFIDGSTRYARWTDVSSGSDRQISLSGVLSIK